MKIIYQFSFRKKYFYFLVLIIFNPSIVFAQNYYYDITISKKLNKLNVGLCLKKYKKHTGVKVKFITKPSAIQFSKKNRQYDCFGYQATLKSALKTRLKGVTQKKQILTNPKNWLWYPTELIENDKVIVNFKHARGINVSAPWQLLNRTKSETEYQYLKQGVDWESVVAFGMFDVIALKIKNATIQYALLNGRGIIDKAKIARWVRSNLTALTTVYGHFPISTLQLLVVPMDNAKEPVPWGEVMRGGGNAVHLYIGTSFSQQDFLNDWVLSHELSHLLHPRMIKNGAWLYEGMASYYQNIIRSRQGLLTAELAWEKLHAGFDRGYSNTVKIKSNSQIKEKNLDQITKNMRKNRAFMRIYWSGAAMSLLADVRLRQITNNKKSLDSILFAFNECCLSDSRWWTAYEVMNKFDMLSNTSIFTEIYQENVYSDNFPDLSNTYLQLGLSANGHELLFINEAPNILREKIMGGLK